MFQIIGNLTLILALLIQVAILFRKVIRPGQYNDMYSEFKKIYFVSAILLLGSFMTLITAFLTHQYQIEAVMENSENSMNSLELISATWAGRAGVLLLWSTLSSFCTIFVLYKFENERQLKVIDRSLSILLFMNMLVTAFNFAGGSTPFTSGINYSNGYGISPSLESFWHQIHPPLAFIAYAAFMFPYALGVSALIGFSKQEKLTELSIRISRNLMMIGWGCLNLLMVAGSIWAYEANWNGFWAWDPIEVASLIMWVLVTAYFHVSSISEPNDPIRLVMMTSGWLGVSFASFVVRSGLWEGFHGYVGIEKAIVFGSILLLSILGVVYGITKSKAQIIPDSLSNLNNKTPHVLTFWTLLGIVLINLVGLFIQLYNNLALRDETIPYEYYMFFNGLLFLALVLLLVACDSNSNFEKNSRLTLSIFGIGFLAFVLLFYRYLLDFFLVLLLASLIGGALITQLVSIFKSLKYKQNSRRIRVQIVHLSIIVLILPYFVVDFSTTRVNISASPDNLIEVPEFDLTFELIKVFEDVTDPYPQYKIRVIDNSGDITVLEIHQGNYKGSYWNRGDWVVQPYRDIYFILLDSNTGYVVDPLSPVNIQISEKPYANLFRISMVVQFFMFSMVLVNILKPRNVKKVE